MKKVEGRVIRAQSGYYYVKTNGKIIECSLRGKIKYEKRSEDGKILFFPFIEAREIEIGVDPPDDYEEEEE